MRYLALLLLGMTSAELGAQAPATSGRASDSLPETRLSRPKTKQPSRAEAAVGDLAPRKPKSVTVTATDRIAPSPVTSAVPLPPGPSAGPAKPRRPSGP